MCSTPHASTDVHAANFKPEAVNRPARQTPRSLHLHATPVQNCTAGLAGPFCITHTADKHCVGIYHVSMNDTPCRTTSRAGKPPNNSQPAPSRQLSWKDSNCATAIRPLMTATIQPAAHLLSQHGPHCLQLQGNKQPNHYQLLSGSYCGTASRPSDSRLPNPQPAC